MSATREGGREGNRRAEAPGEEWEGPPALQCSNSPHMRVGRLLCNCEKDEISYSAGAWPMPGQRQATRKGAAVAPPFPGTKALQAAAVPRRRVEKPTRPKPTIISAQVCGSGTPLMNLLPYPSISAVVKSAFLYVMTSNATFQPIAS